MRYGYLTTHRRTYFIKYVGSNRYAITKAFM